MSRRNTPRVSFIGFGEAGQAIAAGLRESGLERLAAWDILFPVAEGARLKAAGEKMGVRLANSAADAVAETDLIISAVTAASSVEAGGCGGASPDHPGGARGLECRGGAFGRAAPQRRALLSRHQLGVARPQAGDREALRRTGALRRRGGCRAHLYGGPPHAAVNLWTARAADLAATRRTGHEAHGGRRQDRPGGGDQDDPQRDDQGHRGTDA